jgi:DNA-binding NarL/FixJ family response regulator
MKLFLLLVDDEPGVLKQLVETLPTKLDGFDLVWDPCESFEEGLARLESRRYDVVVTDMAFRGKPGAPPDFRGIKTIEQIRGKRFCPIVAYSSRTKPEGLFEGVFLRFADKARGNDDIIAKLREVLASGVPAIARRLHDELDGVGGHYLWEFLTKRWDELGKIGSTTPEALERLLRRRAAIQLARLEQGSEIDDVGASEFYIHPKISGEELRLGEILKRKGSAEYRVVLTPHCHLKIQAGEKEPRAEFVLTVRTMPAQDEILKVWDKKKSQFNLKNADGVEDAARRLIGSPPDLGTPKGRFWFLPRFLEMPDLYCDFMQIESLPLAAIQSDFEAVGVLDTPFAEALQARFAEFYSAVGTANLRPKEFLHLIPKGGADKVVVEIGAKK